MNMGEVIKFKQDNLNFGYKVNGRAVQVWGRVPVQVLNGLLKKGYMVIFK
jgi:hypothetical protein